MSGQESDEYKKGSETGLATQSNTVCSIGDRGNVLKFASRGVVVENTKVWSLAYTDDRVLISRDKKEW